METFISFDIDGLKILGAYKEEMHIQGDVYEDDTIGMCVLVISNDLFFKIFNKWLKRKRDYCENTQTYCGVSTINVDKYRFCGEAYINTFDDSVDVDSDDYVVPVDVPMFEVLKCTVDMEHG